MQEPLGQSVLGRRPPGKEIESPLGVHDTLGRLAQLLRAGLPPGHEAKHRGGFCVEVVEHATQKLAEDQRVHQSRLVLGLDGVSDGVDGHPSAIYPV